MPALLPLQSLQRYEMPVHLLPRVVTYNASSQSSSRTGLHPAVIFGIAAGVMLLVVVVIWCGMFRLWKRMMTNRQYGVLPTLRVAANGLQPTNAPYSTQPPIPNSPYGPQPMNAPYDPQLPTNAYGAPYAPYGGAPYGGQAPPPYSGGADVGLTTQLPAASHSRSPSAGSTNKPLPGINKSLPLLHDR